MEVHHHPDLHHEKKKWKEYFLEFLMIFLAVTLGFFAENMREHISERKSARSLALSFLEDMKKDTASLHSEIAFSEKKVIASDSSVLMLHKPLLRNDTAMYRNITTVLTVFPFMATNGTYEQMKASGSLRFLDQSLVNLMNGYAVQLEITKFRDEMDEKTITNEVGPFLLDVMNLEVLADIRLNLPISHSMYLKVDSTSTDRFVNSVTHIKLYAIRSLMEYKKQLALAEHLITVLEKEYVD